MEQINSFSMNNKNKTISEASEHDIVMFFKFLINSHYNLRTILSYSNSDMTKLVGTQYTIGIPKYKHRKYDTKFKHYDTK